MLCLVILTLTFRVSVQLWSLTHSPPFWTVNIFVFVGQSLEFSVFTTNTLPPGVPCCRHICDMKCNSSRQILFVKLCLGITLTMFFFMLKKWYCLQVEDALWSGLNFLFSCISKMQNVLMAVLKTCTYEHHCLWLVQRLQVHMKLLDAIQHVHLCRSEPLIWQLPLVIVGVHALQKVPRVKLQECMDPDGLPF